MKISKVKISDIKPYFNNPRDNSNAVIPTMESIKRYGFIKPIICDKEGVIICGHTRYLAAFRLGHEFVPVIYSDMDEEKAKHFRIADNKVAEKSEYDEEKLYNYTYEFGNDIAECDKYDNVPDAKGKIKPRYTDFVNMSYGQQFGQFYNAGAYYYGQENYEKAYYLFKMFIDASDKLYKAGIIGKDTVNVPVAAYNMSLCGMQIKNYDMVLSHVDMAMAHPDFASSAFRYKTAAYLEKGDTATWLNLCKEGTMKYPKDAYFNQALIQYYDNKGENDKLDALADELIASDPQNPLFVYLKGYIAQSKYERKEQKEQLDVAIEWYKKTLDVDGSYETALANLGRCYLLKAQEYSNEKSSTKITDKKKLAKDQFDIEYE